MKISLDKSKGKLVLAFSYKKELVEAIKELPDRQYNPNTKEWTVGFDNSNLQTILAMLAGNNWPPEMLTQVETDAKLYLNEQKDNAPDTITEKEFTQNIKPPIVKIGELVLAAYLEGKITQAEQNQMLEIINHLSIKDFIRS